MTYGMLYIRITFSLLYCLSLMNLRILQRIFEQLASLRMSWFLLAKWVRLRRMASKLTHGQTVKYCLLRSLGGLSFWKAIVTATYAIMTSILSILQTFRQSKSKGKATIGFLPDAFLDLEG